MAKRKTPKNGKPVNSIRPGGFFEKWQSQVVLERAAWEASKIQQIGGAFMTACAQELIENHQWTPQQCADLMTETMKRTGALLKKEADE